MVTRKEQDKRLMEALVEARSANAVKSEFLSHMSHDIRTPINGILGMLSIMERSEDDECRRSECTRKIRMAAEHLLSLVNDVLDISKLESGQHEMTREVFNLSELVENCISMVRAQAESQGIWIEETRLHLTHRNYIGSPLHLRQILMNILSNSVKYNRPGGRVRVTVEEISWDENNAFGSLPIAKEEAAAEEEIPEETSETLDISGLRILMAEDNDLNREIVEYMLENAGAEVVNARNGKEAVDIFAQSSPGELDCILMDVMMPVMDGMEATRAIGSLEREDAAKIPIIALTANAFAEDVEKAKQAGMNEHLAKPLDIDKMLRVLAFYAKNDYGKDRKDML